MSISEERGGSLPFASFFIKRSIQLKKWLKPSKNKIVAIATAQSCSNASNSTLTFEWLNPAQWGKLILEWINLNYYTILTISTLVFTFVFFIFIKGNKKTTLFKLNGLYIVLAKVMGLASACVYFGQNLAGIIISSISLISLFVINSDLIELSSVISIVSVFLSIFYCFTSAILQLLLPKKTAFSSVWDFCPQ